MLRFLPTLVLIASLTAPAVAQETLQPGENLVLKNVPAIPKTLADRVARYQNLRSAAFASWLPDGAGMLISTRFAEVSQVHLVPMAGGRREQLTFFGERVAWAAHSPKKGASLFLFGMDAGGTEAYQIYAFDRATGQHSLLTDGQSRHMSLVWQGDGARVAFASNARNGKDFDVYLMDPLAPEGKRLLIECAGMHVPLDISPDGKQVLVQHYVSINQSHLYLVDAETGQRTDLTPADEKEVAYGGAAFSADGKRVYLTTDQGWEFVRLGYVELKDAEKTIHFVTKNTNWDVEHFAVAPDGGQIAYVTNEGGFSKLHLVDARKHKPQKDPEVPAGLIYGLEYDRTGKQLAFSATGSRLPGDVFVYDVKRKKTARWTFSETAGLQVGQFSEPTLIQYPTFDEEVEGKRKIPALLYLPPERFKPPYPVLVLIHGGPESQARPYFLGQYNYWINELGIALIQPNVRGSSGYGKNYLLLDNGKLRENSVKDIGALLDWVDTRADLDKTRVAVSGGSYGGYMSLASLTYYSDRLRCGIDYVGISNFVTFLENTKAYRQDLRRAEYGDERKPGMRMFLDMISPLNNVAKIEVPLLVLQGANDPRVPASEAEQIVERLEAKGKEVWYLLAKDEGHGFVKKSNRDFLNLTVIQFLEKHLLGTH